MNFLSADAYYQSYQYGGLHVPSTDATVTVTMAHTGRHLLEAKYVAYTVAVEDTLRVTGVLSVLGSLAVCLTCLLFWKSMVSNKIYMQMILMISMSDFVTSITVMWGVPTDATLCSWQSGLGRLFFRATWFWATFMILTLWTYISRGTSFMSFRNMHLLCWSLNLLLTFLPLSTETYYGEDDDRLGKTLCSFKAGDDEAMVRNKMVKVWIVATSYVPCSLSVVTMFVLLFMTARKVRAFNTTSGMRIRKLVRNTSLYPFITVLLWLPNMICFLVAEWGYPHRPSSEVYWNNIYLPTRLTYCWATLGGFWIALAFFVNSREARHRWRALLWGPAETEGGTSGRRMDGDSLESQPSSPRSGSQRQSSMTSGTGSNYYDSEEDFDFKEDSEYERESVSFPSALSDSDLQSSGSGSSASRSGADVGSPFHEDRHIDDGEEGEDISVVGIEMQTGVSPPPSPRC